MGEIIDAIFDQFSPILDKKGKKRMLLGYYTLENNQVLLGRNVSYLGLDLNQRSSLKLIKVPVHE